jgi:predicted MFS family arabinose efflux permease
VFVAGQALALHAGGEKHAGATGSTVRLALVIGVPLGLVAGGLLSGAVGPARTFEAASMIMVVATVVAFFGVPDLRAPIRRAASVSESLRTLSDPPLAAIGALNFITSFSSGGLVLTTMALLVRARSLTVFGLGEQEMSGALMGLMVVGSAVSTLGMSRAATSKRANTRVALAGLVLTAAGLAVIGLAQGMAGVTAGLVVMGLGAGALGAALLALVGQLIEPSQRGAGVGLQQLCGDLGGSLGPIVGTSLFGVSPATPYVVCAVLVATSIPIAVWLVRGVGAEERAGS